MTNPGDPTPGEPKGDPLRSPFTWRRLGLVALLAVVAVILVMQMMGGNRQTDVIPGTPIAAPENSSQP